MAYVYTQMSVGVCLYMASAGSAYSQVIGFSHQNSLNRPSADDLLRVALKREKGR